MPQHDPITQNCKLVRKAYTGGDGPKDCWFKWETYTAILTFAPGLMPIENQREFEALKFLFIQSQRSAK